MNETPFPAAARNPYWIELATEEKALFAFDPTKRIVPTTRTKITASITAYSAHHNPGHSASFSSAQFLIQTIRDFRGEQRFRGLTKNPHNVLFVS